MLYPAGGELEGSKKEDGTLQYIMERETRLHASDKIRAGQGELLKVRIFCNIVEEEIQNERTIYLECI